VEDDPAVVEDDPAVVEDAHPEVEAAQHLAQITLVQDPVMEDALMRVVQIKAAQTTVVEEESHGDDQRAAQEKVQVVEVATGSETADVVDAVTQTTEAETGVAGTADAVVATDGATSVATYGEMDTGVMTVDTSGATTAGTAHWVFSILDQARSSLILIQSLSLSQHLTQCQFQVKLLSRPWINGALLSMSTLQIFQTSASMSVKLPTANQTSATFQQSLLFKHKYFPK